MSPVPKRAFAFRYIESLGQENHGCPAVNLLKIFACPTEKIGCPRPSECKMFKAWCHIVA